MGPCGQVHESVYHSLSSSFKHLIANMTAVQAVVYEKEYNDEAEFGGEEESDDEEECDDEEESGDNEESDDEEESGDNEEPDVSEEFDEEEYSTP